MSNVLAIAAVTQLLKDLLNNALIDGDAGQALGADFIVTALPPDRVVAESGSQQATQLNLFLHRITPNEALRNSDLPTRSGDGQILCRPRLALDLHYMLTAVSSEELHAEILLGYAMQLFHETALLPREAIRAALDAVTIDTLLPQDFDPIRASELADQIELIKITPRTLSMDDMSKMWTALQASYRTTVAYDVSVVLIERNQPSRPTLPVLSRGGLVDPDSGRDPGVSLRPDLIDAIPTLNSVAPTDGQLVMRLSGDITLSGYALDGGEATVRFTEPGSGTVIELAPRLPTTPNRLLVRLPSGAPRAPGDPLANTGSDPGVWRIGPYTLNVAIIDNSGRELRTNALPLALAPLSEATAQRVDGETAITISCQPSIRAGQSVEVLAGTEMAVLASPAGPMDTVVARFSGFSQGDTLPVRLRVDGIDSPVINRHTEPPSIETVTVA
jgi:hypothetical protein